ncbi:hypothetical protein M5D96_008963, partial [Drosophila gunungcola]
MPKFQVFRVATDFTKTVSLELTYRLFCLHGLDEKLDGAFCRRLLSS